MNSTLELLRFIGSPFAPETSGTRYNDAELFELHQLSFKNRMRFPFLEALNKREDIGDFKTLYGNEKTRCAENIAAICNVSGILTDSGVPHATFKTLRPYKSTTVDIDTIIFGRRSEYLRATKSLQNAGCKVVVFGPRSATLLDPTSHMGVDLYEQVAVSYFIYIDKEKLTESVTTAKFSNGNAKILTPEADLSTIIAHSVVKEQMYTLSEYYSFIHYLNSIDVSKFLELLKQNNLVSVAAAHASITALLHKMAHKMIPYKLKQILEGLSEKSPETNILAKDKIITPHKYHMLTVARSFLEIMKWKKCRDSIATQILRLSNPRFSRDFFRDLLKHTSRKTY